MGKTDPYFIESVIERVQDLLLDDDPEGAVVLLAEQFDLDLYEVADG